ncbi:MAG: Stk1 family PASTA domain-containing Ser/Thr kinase [Bacilli bacterium]
MMEKDYLLDDRYIIKRNIGEGGMANVYLAFDKILQRNVAIKVLRGDLSDDELFIKRFRREALAATALNHPNIVQIFDIGEENGKYFIVMEYVEGITLKQLLLKRKRLTISEVTDIIKQITLGIAHAHSKQIIHRDIKPHNILIQKDGTVKITDFGIAVTLNSTLLTQTNSILGSVHYLPPEQISGDVANVRSDIYSIGILMYELLTGELPYNGDSAVTIALMHVREKFPSPRSIDSSISQSIENIVIRATAKNPKNRYGSADEMFEELENAGKNENVEKLVLDDKMEEEVVNTLLNKSDDVEIISTQEPKKKKVKTLVVIISLLVVVTSLVLILVATSNETETIIVPDVIGMNREEATKELVDTGFTISTEVKFESSSEFPVDTVISLNVKEGTEKPLGFSIVLTVSTGPSKYIMENFTGQDVNAVKSKLEGMGFVVSVQEKEVQDSKSENLIIEQTPISGTEVEAGSIITLYVSKVSTYYPNFVSDGYNKDSIQGFCTNNAISCTFQYSYSDTVAEGNIISQSISAGNIVNTSDSLIIVISSGKETVEE